MSESTTKVSVETSAPESKPAQIVTRRSCLDRLPWQRITLSLLGIAILVGMWRWATFHLYVLPEYSVSAFTSVTNNTVYAIAALVIFFVTGRLVYEWKNQTVSQVVEQTQHLFEKRDEKIEHVITHRTEGGAKAFTEGEEVE